MSTAASGTPKLGVWCRVCDDWGTVVVGDSPSEGVTHLREIKCPQHTPAPASPADCRCNGSGKVTIEIPLADALLIDGRDCPNHTAAPAVRELWETAP